MEMTLVAAYWLGLRAVWHRSTVEGAYCLIDWYDCDADLCPAVPDGVTASLMRLRRDVHSVPPNPAADALLAAADSVHEALRPTWAGPQREAIWTALVRAADEAVTAHHTVSSQASKASPDPFAGWVVTEAAIGAVAAQPSALTALGQAIEASPVSPAGWAAYEAAADAYAAALPTPYRELFGLGRAVGRVIFPWLDDHEPQAYACRDLRGVSLVGRVKTYDPAWIFGPLADLARACVAAVRCHTVAFISPADLVDRFEQPVRSVADYHRDMLASLHGLSADAGATGPAPTLNHGCRTSSWMQEGGVGFPDAVVEGEKPSGGSEGEKPKTDAKADGPFDPDGFRFGGVEVRFGNAVKQYRLVTALWDAKKERPAEPRPIADVFTDVWGDNNDTEDAAFRQLCSVTRRRFEAAICPLGIEQTQGKV